MPVTDVDAAIVGARRSAANREVLAADIDAPAIHLGQAAHAADGSEVGQLTLFVVGRAALELAHLVERARVHQ